MNANEHLDFYNPDSIYYANSHHYIQQLEKKVRQQQAEIEALKIRELTYEEIEECCCFLDVRLHHRYEPNAVVKDIEWTVTGIKDFVEAILRKASEK